MRRAWPGWALLALILVAAALRFTHLETQSLWADEGNSVAMAPRPPLEIIQRTARDIHPPLYYLSLHYWSALAGRSVFAVRAWSVWLGVLAVALTAALARRGAGTVGALIAALLAALSPFALYYSQETRMYALVMALGAASWLALVGRRPGHAWPRHPAAYLALTLAMLYGHYYAVALLVAQNGAWLLAAWRGRWGRAAWARWIGGQLGILALYLPWLWYARATILGWPAISPDVTLPFIARETFRIFSLGLANEGMTIPAALGFGTLLALGLVATLRDRRPGAWFPLLYVATPPALMLLLSLDRPFWNPKFLLLALPGYHLLLARGAAALVGAVRDRHRPRLGGALGLALAAMLVALVARPLAATLTDPRYWRDDYQRIAQLIAAQATPRDAVLLSGAGQREVFDYYFGETLPRYGLPATQPLDEAATLAALERIAAQHERLWVLWWAEGEGDPAGIIPRWLEQHAFEAGSRWFGNVRLASYRLGELPAPRPLNVPFAPPDAPPILHLQGASLAPETVVAGEVLALNSAWARLDSLDSPLVFFAQLLDGANHVVGQYDGDGGAPPVPAWPLGERQPVRAGIPVAVGTPPGDYRLILGAYRADTGERLPPPDGDAYPLATVRVIAPAMPPTLDALGLRHGEARRVPFGGATLVGARAHRLGADHAPDSPLAPGDPLTLLLWWRAEQAAPTLPALTLRLSDARGHALVEWPLDPTEGRHPPARWQPAELIRDPQTRFLPATLPAGHYRLTLEDGRHTAEIATITVQ